MTHTGSRHSGTVLPFPANKYDKICAGAVAAAAEEIQISKPSKKGLQGFPKKRQHRHGQGEIQAVTQPHRHRQQEQESTPVPMAAPRLLQIVPCTTSSIIVRNYIVTRLFCTYHLESPLWRALCRPFPLFHVFT